MPRQRSLHGVAALLVATLALSIRVESAVFAASLPSLHPDGTRMVDASGKPVVLRGCNLGNWLMIEPWMLGGCFVRECWKPSCGPRDLEWLGPAAIPRRWRPKRGGVNANGFGRG